MEQKWYQKSYRRSLIDMHIEDWNEEFLSEFTPENHLAYFKEAKVDATMLQMQTHVGLCYYPTRLGVMHKSFEGREDTMNRLIDLCHQNGIAVVGYYSLVYNNRTEQQHPDWGMLDDGKSMTSAFARHETRYGFCCPNNPDYRAFVKGQIAEIAETFPTLDGLFFDQTNWPYVCHCNHCRDRFAKETGNKTLPDAFDMKNERSALFREKRYEWLADFAKFVSDTAKALFPNATVSHNNAQAICRSWKCGVDERVIDTCTYATGDQYIDIMAHSFSQKYYYSVTPNQPFEYMVTRFAKDLTQHTSSKSPRELSQITLLTVAHHGANFMVDTIDPVGTVDHDMAKTIAVAYERQIPYEKYLQTGTMLADIGVWYSITGRYNSAGQEYTGLWASFQAGATLSINHIPYGVVANKRLSDLQKYPLVIAPSLGGLTKEYVDAATEYVQNGGVLCFSGTEAPELLKAFFGAEVEGYTDITATYLAPTEAGAEVLAPFTEKYPLSLSHKHPLIKGVTDDTVVLGKLKMPYRVANDPMAFASIHSNPPGVSTEYPSIMERSIGKGRAVWLGVPIEFYADRQHRDVFMNLIRRYYAESEQTLTTTASKHVELITFQDEREVLVSAVNIGDAEDGRMIPAFEVTVKTDAPVTGVYLLPSETSVPFTYAEGKVTFASRELDLFDMYRILLA
ncbi:MAG: hypothetical protein J6B71_03140 [Clostridia bacterium]|nr:hypothetical protein [Clostridia bacterium]